MRGSSVIHAAVDGGMYLYDLKTDGQTTWSNTVEVEVKGARGAGFFHLTLDVEDNVELEAVVASWTFAKEGPGKVDKAVQHMEAVKGVLENAMLKAEKFGTPPVPMPVADIRDKVGLKKASVDLALTGLAVRGEARQISRQGWVLVRRSEPKPGKAGVADNVL